MKGTWWIPLVLCCTLAFAAPAAALEPPALAWNVTLGGGSDDLARAVQQTTDGGYVVAGETQSNDGDIADNHGLYDAWVGKLDGTGQIAWTRALGGSGLDEAHDVDQTSDGGYVVAGYTVSTNGDVVGNHGLYDAWVVKLDASGQIAWTRALGGSSYDEARAVQQTVDGGYVVAGWTQSTDGDLMGNHGSADFWVVKLDAAGRIEWTKALGGSSWDEAVAVQQTTDGGYVVSGYTGSTDGDVTGSHGGTDCWVVKLDAEGDIAWNRTLGGSKEDSAYAVDQASDGGYIVAGRTYSADGDVVGNHGWYDAWVVKLDSSGQIAWTRALGGSHSDYAYAVNQASDGGYVVAGETQSTNGDFVGNHGVYDGWVVKLDGAGQIAWIRALGGRNSDFAYAVQQTSDGGYIVAGQTYSNDGDVGGVQGYGDAWVVKFAAEGPAVLALPPSSLVPTDPNNDGKYDDVNGNGRPDFADVVLYFNQMGWIPGHEPISAFDYNSNGRIDFADVVWLFNYL